MSRRASISAAGSGPTFLEKVSGNNVEVKDGAFRSKRKWYNIQFKCELDAGSGRIVSSAFRVGDAIPRDEWQEHNLVADDGVADQ
ncbi:DUF930 domain-containing protein [Rhizobium leguminosarum]|nr:DUF930 domain-containing protein [Rhizobium leguminosarum]MBY5556389.1 DUF930 domain-containing protein [Rhizobium leguminosarum]MBY5638860.1 DUF930 domain-containing protein [Rhizobium leguminosarum]MBY5687953.1 DUF930 domain-containing protein [Rhizobium leguminosarum]MBY5726151.1 DUF930 domain-containing protein [Rhizobium leguminosarum]MBY5742469.1 DUF930 domain-containing protein [Rhizobium leguminosarum]